MPRFVQLHVLTSYPPSNLNRDDLGRPKSAQMGGVNRLRISSQALKRSWRTSDVFTNLFGELGENKLGQRTKRMGVDWIYPAMLKEGIEESAAKKWSVDLQRIYGAPDKKNDEGADNNSDGKSNEAGESDSPVGLLNSQAAHVAPAERMRLAHFVADLVKYLKTDRSSLDPKQLGDVEAVVKAVAKRDTAGDKKKANITLSKTLADTLLMKPSGAVDIALFGRMLAAVPYYNVEAAAQVAHAITVHRAEIQDDYFSAVEDLNDGSENAGAAHIGELGFGAGVFYLYLCINRDLLIENLGGGKNAQTPDKQVVTEQQNAAEKLAAQTLKALVEAVTKVSPTGKQNSFASRCWASYVMAEVGEEQPRSLSLAFLNPVGGEGDYMRHAITRLEGKRLGLEEMYGPGANDWRVSVDGEYKEVTEAEKIKKRVSLKDLIAFINSGLPCD